MLHRIKNWCNGYLRVCITGETTERFANLCRYHQIVLWEMQKKEKCSKMYFNICLKDYYKLRPIAKKCHAVPGICERMGLPFWIQSAKKRKSFWMGIFLGICLLQFLPTRIWKISLEGQSYHTEESMLEYLNDRNVYGGISKKSVQCDSLEQKIREDFPDIGWVSVEKKGSRLNIAIEEVILVEKETKIQSSHLTAQEDGVVHSIVTRQGKAKVKAGKKVKKEDILISGVLKITDDNGEVMEKKYVEAEGSVVLEVTKEYEYSLKKNYEKKKTTKKNKKVHQWTIFGRDFFLYNPLNHLETYKKCDIIREGGQLCPFVSLRFPVSHYVLTCQETNYVKAVYTREQAEKQLQERYAFYLENMAAQGYEKSAQKLQIEETEDAYVMRGKVTFLKEQNTRRAIKKNKKNEEIKKNGDNGNRDGNTNGT